MNETPGGGPLAGIRVVAFESRMAGPMADLIARQGGQPLVAPSLRELPIDDNEAVFQFADDLIAARYEIVVFMTGVGTRFLAQAIETRHPRDAWISALERVLVLARGPKPLAALRALGARVDLQVPEPNTWNEVLATLDTHRDLAGTRVAVQEYGQSNPDLIEGLRQRGAAVTPVTVYRWALPEDIGPLRQAASALAAGQVQAALFTSAQQVVHLFQVAAEMGLETRVQEALRQHVIVASIGPVTSEALLQRGIAVQIEPEHPKMGHLVAALAARWPEVKKAPGRAADAVTDTARTDELYALREPARVAQPPRDTGGGALQRSRFLRACRGEPTDVTPIWLMRQAGRYMAEYRAVREKVSFLDLCKTPELATEVTVTAAKKLGVDAAILFADILLILEPLGFELDFPARGGPVLGNPLDQPRDVDRVRELADAQALGFVYDAVRMIRQALPADLPLIGFAGAPFTLACYAIEGGSSRHYLKAKSFMYGDAGAFDAFMGRLTRATVMYLQAQAAAGAQVLQVFDSWVGTLSPDDYRRFVLPHMQTLFRALPADIPAIHFGTDSGGLLELMREAGGQVIGLDWRIDLDAGWSRLGPRCGVQGNLDPATLLAPWPILERQTRRILNQARGRPGHIFNLGHGVLPQTPVQNAIDLVRLVQSIPCRPAD